MISHAWGREPSHLQISDETLLCTEIRSVGNFSFLLDNGDKIALWCLPVIVHLS